MNERWALNIFSGAVSWKSVRLRNPQVEERSVGGWRRKTFGLRLGRERVSPGEESGVEEGEENFCRPQQEKKRSESQSLKFSTVVWRDFSPPLFLVRVS